VICDISAYFIFKSYLHKLGKSSKLRNDLIEIYYLSSGKICTDTQILHPLRNKARRDLVLCNFERIRFAKLKPLCLCLIDEFLCPVLFGVDDFLNTLAVCGIQCRRRDGEGVDVYLNLLIGLSVFVDTDKGAFGVKGALIDPVTGEILEHGSKFRMELGAQLIANVNYEIFKNVIFTSKLVVFYDYMQTREFNALDKEYGCRLDFDWDNAIVMKVNDWLNCNVTARLIYDEDIKPIEGDSFLQFKEVLSVGISYRIP
jgi:hypothetical protein